MDLKKCLLHWVDFLIEREHIFSHFSEMNIIRSFNKRILSYEHYIKQPMEAVELKLNTILLEILL